MQSNVHPPRVGLRIGRQIVPAIPVALGGDQASLLFRDIPRAHGDVLILLDWADGAVTELGARVSLIEDDLSIMRFEVFTIGGDWEPFLAYLGEERAKACVGGGAAA